MPISPSSTEVLEELRAAIIDTTSIVAHKKDGVVSQEVMNDLVIMKALAFIVIDIRRRK